MCDEGTYVTLCTMCMHIHAHECHVCMYTGRYKCAEPLRNARTCTQANRRNDMAGGMRAPPAGPTLEVKNERSRLLATGLLVVCCVGGHRGRHEGSCQEPQNRRRPVPQNRRRPVSRPVPSRHALPGGHRCSTTSSRAQSGRRPLCGELVVVQDKHPSTHVNRCNTAATVFVLAAGGQEEGVERVTTRVILERVMTLVMVEFPGIVVNDAAALATFGGAAGVAAALRTPGAMLPLHLRPEDPQGTAIFGDRVPTKNLVVRVVRRRGAPAGAPVRAEVVARVPEAFSFKGMADFQVPRGVACHYQRPQGCPRGCRVLPAVSEPPFRRSLYP